MNILLQRRGPKEQTDHDGNNENADDDLLDQLDSEEFFLAGSQGIDQAILQSIERCRAYILIPHNLMPQIVQC